MQVLENERVTSYLSSHRLTKKFKKQVRFLETEGTSYNSLNWELLKGLKGYPKNTRIYSFRVDGAYRAFCKMPDDNTIEVFDVNNHDYRL